MNIVYHRDKALYGEVHAVLLDDASAYAMITVFDNEKSIAVIHDVVVLKDY